MFKKIYTSHKKVIKMNMLKDQIKEKEKLHTENRFCNTYNQKKHQYLAYIKNPSINKKI